MLDAAALRDLHRALEKARGTVEGRSVGRGRRDDEPAGRAIERLARARLQLAPERVRARDERHEDLALAHRQPRDPAQAVARAEVVRRHEAVDADHLPPVRAR